MGNLKIVDDRDRDWPITTVGITGLKKIFGRDGGIEEPYWGPSLVTYFQVSRVICANVLIWINSGNTSFPVTTPFMVINSFFLDY